MMNSDIWHFLQITFFLFSSTFGWNLM